MFGMGIGRMGRVIILTVLQRALSALRALGTNGHAYTAGTGSVNGLNTGNYTLSDGSTGLAAVDGPVGLVLDGAGSVGSELAGTLDGTWTRDATVSNVGSTMVAAGLTTGINGFFKSIGASGTGNTFLVTVVVSAYTSGQITAWLGVQQNAASNAFISGTGTLQFYVTATGSANGFIIIGSNVASNTWTVSSISAKQVTGIHATQATAGNRPTLIRGVVNLGLSSANVGNATYWTPNQVNAIAANLVTPNAVSSTHLVTQTVTTLAQVYTVAFELRPNGYTKFACRENTSTGAYAAFNCVGAGSVLVTSSTTATILALASGAYLVTLTLTTAAVASQFGSYVLDAAYTNTTPNAYLWSGDNVSGTYINGFGLFTGTYTATQILAAGGIPLTTAAAASNASAGKFALSFDGVDDILSMPQAAYGIADDFVVIVAATCNNKAAFPFPIIAAKSDSGAIPQIGSLYFDASGFASALYRTDANVNTFVPGPVFSDSTPCVLTHIKQAGFCRTDVNNTLGTPVAAPGGVYTVNAGAIGTVLNGLISQVYVLKGSFTEAQILTFKRAAAATLNNGPVF